MSPFPAPPDRTGRAVSRIQLSDHLRRPACASVLPNGSLFPPFGTADIGMVEVIPHRFLTVRQGHWCLRRSHNCNSLRTAQSTLWDVLLLLPTRKWVHHPFKIGFNFWITTPTCPSDGSDRNTSSIRRRVLRHAFSRGHINSIRPAAFRNPKPRNVNVRAEIWMAESVNSCTRKAIARHSPAAGRACLC